MDRTKYLIKNTGILTISNFASKILVFLLVPIYTSVLTTSEYGTYDLIISTIALVMPVLTFNISDAVMRFSMDPNSDRENVLKVGLRITFRSIAIGWVIILILYTSGLLPEINDLVGLIAIYYFVHTMNQFLFQMARGYERVSDIGIAGVISTVVMIAANLVLLLLVKAGLKGFFAAMILGQFAPVIYLSFRLHFFESIRTVLRKPIDKKLRQEMITYSVPLIATTLGWWVNSTSDRYIVAFICGVGANGLLSVAYKIPAIINTLQGIFIQAWQISAIKEYDSTDKAAFYDNAFYALNLMMATACSVLILLTKPIAHILFAKDFYTAWQYVPFLLLSCVFNSASGFLGPVLSAKKDSKTTAYSAIYGSTANVILNIALVYLTGIQGACIATAISSLIIYYVRKRSLLSDMDFGENRALLVTWGLLCIQATIEIVTDYWYVELLLMIVMMIVNRNELQKLLKMAGRFIKRD